VNFVLVFQPCVCLPAWLVWGIQNCLERVYLLSRKFLFRKYFCFLVWKSLHPIGFYISSGGLKGLGLLCKLLFLSTSVREELLIIIPMVKSMNHIWELEAKSQWLARVCQIAAANCNTSNR
jgi:hypothetical protein